MKVFIRKLENSPRSVLWYDDDHRERVRRYLNRLGFYVLTQDDGSLHVYALRDDQPLDVRLYEVVLKWLQGGMYGRNKSR